MNEKDILINTCPSPSYPVLGSHIGIQIKHKLTGIVVRSIDKNSQFKNKQEAIEMLKLELVKE
jgi:protein subunit release factor A